jgi:hypothetical protein
MSADPKAARRHLVRMLAGDAERPRPAVTLPGRYTGNGAHDRLVEADGLDHEQHHRLVADKPGLDHEQHHRAGARAHERPGPAPRGHSSRCLKDGAEPLPEDAAGPYSHEQLLIMNARFVAAVQRALESGRESWTAAGSNMRRRR